MSRQTESSFLIASSRRALYQHLLSGAATYQDLGSRILRQMETASAFRQNDKVKELARILSNIPISEYQLAAQYHLVLCKCRENEYQSDALEMIAERSQNYKAKALISRAAFDIHKGSIEEGMHFYAEAIKVNPMISDFIKASTGIATLKSREGFSNAALRDLEKLVPVLRYAEPLTLFQALNSYAVELSEHGRLYEAHTVLARAVSSPLAPFYPELQATLSDIESKRKRHSTITISWPESGQALEDELPEDPLQRARIQTVIDFMNENLQRSISVPELAKIVNLSSGYFIHLFKAEMGIPPGAYLLTLRLEKATHLLKNTFLSIKQVMAAVGYNSNSNFVRHFKRRFDVGPSEYRKQAFARHLPLRS